MKRKLVLIGVCILILTVIFVRDISMDIERKQDVNTGVANSSGGITRAQVSKMLSLLYYSEEELDSMERVIVYRDTDKSKWFDKYINGIYSLGIKDYEENISENDFRPLEYITYRDGDSFIKRFLIAIDTETGVDENLKKYNVIIEKSGIHMGEEILDNNITEDEWIKLYLALASSFSDSKIEEKSLYLLGAENNQNSMCNWEAVTNEGIYSCKGLDLTEYTDKNIWTITRKKEILYAKEKEQTEIVLKNTWIISGKDKQLKAFVNGIEKDFDIENPLSKDVENVIGDIKLSEGKVSKISIKPEIINGRVLVSNEEYIEIEDYGKIQLEDGYRIYKTYGELQMEESNGILVGYNTTDFVVSNGKICAALIKNSIKAENIRVLIKTTGFKELLHETVKITSDEDFILKTGKKTKEYKAGKIVTIKADNKMLEEGRIVFSTKKENGKIKILSVKRNGANPEYRGNIEVAKEKEGLTIINELPLEEYLYGVIPSEMPSSYGVEALKVQAVCARSYAYNQLLANRYGSYGAHVDDSVSFQVYNNTEESSEAVKAVKDTYGKVLKYEDEIITAYYFSTSCGHTASVDEVWPGSVKREYLTGKMQNGAVDKEGNIFEAEEETDLSKEKTFKEFIKKSDSKTYDSDFAWYRWKVTIDYKDLKISVDNNLASRYNANPDLIQTLVKTDKKEGTKDALGNYTSEYKSIPVATAGNIKKILVSKREKSGLVSEILIEGSENTVKVKTEYNIRCLLAPINDDIIRQDDSVISGITMLPSGFFTIENSSKDDKMYVITGGGYGHGVGMSQNGVKALADKGVKYENILRHYYTGSDVDFIY